MEGIIYKQERIADAWSEMQPLLEDHFKEVSANQDIKLNPNFFVYNKMEANNGFVLYTARLKGELVGYCAFFLNQNPHYTQSFQAVQDVIFLKKELRGSGLGKALISFCDEKLKDMGVQVVYHHAKTKLDFGPLLKSIGYNHVENIYSKRLDLEG